MLYATNQRLVDILERRKAMASHIDPVCGHPVDDKDAAGSAEQGGVTYYFDSEECMSKFNLRPEQYAGETPM